jgi:hypothetical protein
MLEEQDNIQIKHYAHLRNVLDKSMVLNAPSHNKYKQGYLTLKDKKGEWKDKYLILTSKYLVASNLKNKVQSPLLVHLSLTLRRNSPFGCSPSSSWSTWSRMETSSPSRRL